MARQKKDYVSFTFKLDKDVNDMLIEYCDRTGATKTAAIEIAMAKFFEDYYKKEKLLEKIEEANN